MHEYTKRIKAKGWTVKEVGARWGLKQSRMAQICANPTTRDWDALHGLPMKFNDVSLIGGRT